MYETGKEEVISSATTASFWLLLIRFGGQHRLGELLVWCTSLSSEKREKAKTKKIEGRSK